MTSESKKMRQNTFLYTKKCRLWLKHGFTRNDDLDDIIFKLSGFFWHGDVGVTGLLGDDRRRSERIFELFKENLEMSPEEMQIVWRRITQKCISRKNVKKRRRQSWHQYLPGSGLNDFNAKVATDAHLRISRAIDKLIIELQTLPNINQICIKAKSSRATVKKFLKETSVHSANFDLP